MKHSRNTTPPKRAGAVFPELTPVGDVVAMNAQLSAKTETTARDLATLSINGISSSVLSFRNMNHYGDLLVHYLMARKKVFIDRLKWDLPQTDGMEFDQYDTPECRWIIIHEDDQVLAGVRLVPTTASCGIYSYMLRDGQKGLLHDFPSDVLFFDAPVDSDVWEASRLFVAADVPTHKRGDVQLLLMKTMMRVASEFHAKNVIGIVPAAWSRWLRRLGLYATPVGPKFTAGSMTSQAALFNVDDQLTWANDLSALDKNE